MREPATRRLPVTAFQPSSSFAHLNDVALAVLPAVCRRLFPAGHVVGANYVVGDLQGNPGRSLKISLRKGCWRDFAANVGGSDPISLVAAVAGVSQGEGARLLGRMVGVEVTRD